MLAGMSANMNFTRARPDLEPSPGPGLVPSIDSVSAKRQKQQANTDVTGNPRDVLQLIFMNKLKVLLLSPYYYLIFQMTV